MIQMRHAKMQIAKMQFSKESGRTKIFSRSVDNRAYRLLPAIFMGLCAAGLLSVTSTTWSLSADRDQEVSYTADGNTTISTTDGLRIVTVRDNVFIKQGSMELRGQIAVFEYDQRSSELRKVSVTGNPASFQQQPSESSSLITGTSTNIYYHAGEDYLVELIGSASFTQDGSVMNCVEIRHLVNAGTTEMTGPCSGVLPPQNN